MSKRNKLKIHRALATAIYVGVILLLLNTIPFDGGLRRDLQNEELKKIKDQNMVAILP